MMSYLYYIILEIAFISVCFVISIGFYAVKITKRSKYCLILLSFYFLLLLILQLFVIFINFYRLEFIVMLVE